MRIVVVEVKEMDTNRQHDLVWLGNRNVRGHITKKKDVKNWDKEISLNLVALLSYPI